MKAIVIVIVSLLSLSCSRPLSNSFDDFHLECGIEPNPSFRYFRTQGLISEVSDAVAVDSSPVSNLNILGDGCIEIPKSYQGRIALRNFNTGKLVEFDGQRNGLELSNSSLTKIRSDISCDLDIVTKKIFKLKNQLIVSNRLILNKNTVTILQGDQVIYQKEISSQKPDPEVDLSDLKLDDGTYRLEVSSADIFDLAQDASPKVTSCSLVIDTQPPTVTTNLDQLDDYNSEAGIKLLIEDATYGFSITDDNGVEFFACSKQRQNEFSPVTSCEDDEFKLVESLFRAPRQGVWDIRYFAKDSAGNRSAVNLRSFAVYHDRDLELSRRSLVLASNAVLLNQPIEAKSRLDDTLKEFSRLDLVGEKRALEASLIQTAWNLNQGLTEKSRMEFATDIDQILSDPTGKSAAVLLHQPGRPLDTLKHLVDGQVVGSYQDIYVGLYLNSGQLLALNSEGELLSIFAQGSTILHQLDQEFKEQLFNPKSGRPRVQLVASTSDKLLAILGTTHSRFFRLGDNRLELISERSYPSQIGIKGPGD